jgi:hypothetical protein
MAKGVAGKSLSDWLMPSVEDVVFLAVFFFVLRLRNGLLEGADTARHVLTGKIILGSLHLSHSDPFSYTMAGSSWIPREWLSELLFAAFYRVMGPNGLILLAGICIALTMLLMFRFMLYRGVNLFVALVMICLSAWVINAFTTARPEIFSFLFVLGFVIILDLFQTDDKNWLKVLPVLMVFWANMAGGFVIGLALILFFLACNIAIAVTTRDKASQEACGARSKKLAAFLVICTLAAFVNPSGPAILWFPLRLAGNSFLMDNLGQWLSPNFHGYPQAEILLLIFITAFALSRRRANVIEAGLLVGTVFFGLYSTACFPLVAVIVTPIAAVMISDALGWPELQLPAWALRLRGQLGTLSERTRSLERARRAHLLACSIIIIWAMLAVYAARTARVHFTDRDRERQIFPVDALQFAVANGITGNVFNDQYWSGYILLNTYPRYKVFIDDRSEMYRADVVRQYLKVTNVELGFEKLLDTYGVTWVLLKANSPLCRVLFLTPKWKLVYADGVADILVKDLPENEPLIRQYFNVYFVPNGYLRLNEYDDDPTGTADEKPGR